MFERKASRAEHISVLSPKQPPSQGTCHPNLAAAHAVCPAEVAGNTGGRRRNYPGSY